MQQRLLAAATWWLASLAAPAAAAGTHGLRAAREARGAKHAQAAAQPSAAHVSAQLFPEALEGVLSSAYPPTSPPEPPKVSHTIIEVAEAHEAQALLRFLLEEPIQEKPDFQVAVTKNETAQAAAPEEAGVYHVDHGHHHLGNGSVEEYHIPAAFMEKCLDHVKSLVMKLDGSYTDVHLYWVLMQQCELEEVYPRSVSDGFNHAAACEEFAVLLVQARDDHLATGTNEGYVRFCERYHEHKFGRPEPKAAEPPPPPEQKTVNWIWIVVALAVVAVCLGILYLAVHRSA